MLNYLHESKYFILFHFIDIPKGLCTVVSVSVFTAREMLYLGAGDVAGLGQRNSPRNLVGRYLLAVITSLKGLWLSLHSSLSPVRLWLSGRKEQGENPQPEFVTILSVLTILPPPGSQSSSIYAPINGPPFPSQLWSPFPSRSCPIAQPALPWASKTTFLLCLSFWQFPHQQWGQSMCSWSPEWNPQNMHSP